ncbi:MAG: cysteine desulfurase-like protein [Acidobacteriota bacterium]|nr:cysteine desulfurase-like protein [Acidobacteriota bacterium]
MSTLTLDVDHLRSRFPALARRQEGRPVVYFDGPAGSQVPRGVADAVGRYLLETNANCGGTFASSHESDELLAEAHRSVADFLGSDDPDLVVFGPNMTTLTLALARALAKTWGAGDEVLVTRLEHDANFTPWVQAAADAGAAVHEVDILRDDCTLDMEDLKSKLGERTRFVAVGAASNAVGTINPIGEIADLAHAAGARLFVDAVHFAPHLPIDVGAWDCDYLTCSAYKFFGPHVGILWGRRELLESAPVYKLRPASDALPGRFMTGTQSHEGIAGTMAAIDYLAGLGREHAADGSRLGRRDALSLAYERIASHERVLANRLIRDLGTLREVRIWGITDTERLDERVPTVAITHARRSPREVAEHLARRGIFVWHGNYYALPLTEALGLEPEGLVRIGLLHYNTEAEIDRLIDALRELAG